MESKDEYVKRLHAQIDEWNAEIDRLRAKADAASGEAQMEFHKQLDELEGKRKALREHMEKLDNASHDAWKDMKEGADNAWREFDAAFKRALARLN